MVLIGLAVLLVSLAALAAIGRWERSRNAKRENDEMAAVYRRATSGGLISRRLNGYRLDQTFDCLVYAPRADPAAATGLELCFDAEGRLIETIDRSSGAPHFATLREEPGLATLRVSVSTLIGALRSLNAFADPRLAGVRLRQGILPVGFGDIGVLHSG